MITDRMQRKPIYSPYKGFRCIMEQTTGNMKEHLATPPIPLVAIAAAETFQATIFDSIKDINPSKSIAASHEEFIAYLGNLAQEPMPSKESLFLFSPAYYKLDAIPAREELKTKANIQYCNGIWLDADRCPLSPAEFVARCLPDTRIVCYSTYNSTVAAPRLRYYVPTTEVFSVQMYDVIAHEIVARTGLADHGLDKSKLNAAALFYRPCQPRERAASYFEGFVGEPLDPIEWIESASDENICRYGGDIETDDSFASPIPMFTCNPDSVDRALRDWPVPQKTPCPDTVHHKNLAAIVAQDWITALLLTFNLSASNRPRPRYQMFRIKSFN
jgi:hypothetical protein